MYVAFNKWYSDQVRALQNCSASEHDSISTTPMMQAAISGSVVPAKFWSPLPALSPVAANTNSLAEDAACISRPRAKTIFDPEHELPRLQRWFASNARPSRQQMISYVNELNSLSHRQGVHGRPQLELASICCWFKNARAASRRLQSDDPINAPTNGISLYDVKTQDRTKVSNSEHASLINALDCDMPELPNSNAVYIINPHHDSSLNERKIEVVTPVDDISVPDDVNNDDQPQDLSRNAVIERSRSWLSPEQKSTNKHQSLSDVDDGQSLDSDTDNKLRPAGKNVNDESQKSPDFNLELSRSQEQQQQTTENILPFCNQQLQHSQQRTAMQLAAMSYSMNLRQYMQSAAVGVYPPGVINSLPVAGSASGNHATYKETEKGHKESDRTSTSSSLDDGGGGNEKKKRTRVFIDPLTEIPRLELWFIEDTHPSSYMIEKFTEELNNSPYRLRFPKLEAKNVQLWFKNHRAKVKRQKFDLSPSRAIQDRGTELQGDWTAADSDDSS